MTRTQIKYVQAVAQEKSFSSAARVLYVSQPAVSKQVAMLEDELGFLFFDRTDKIIKLTAEGKIFLEFVTRFERDYEDTMRVIKNKSDDQSGTVTIGCIDTWNTLHFYNNITRYFSEVHPNIKLNIEGYSLVDLLYALREGDIDVGITYRYFVSNQKDIAQKPFVTLNAGILCSLGEDRNNIEDFRDDTFLIGENRGEVTERVLVDACASAGFTPKTKHCRKLSSEITEVLAGTGVMFSDEWSLMKDSPSIKYVPLDYQLPTRLIYMPNRSTKAKNIFINEVMYLFGKGQSAEAEAMDQEMASKGRTAE